MEPANPGDHVARLQRLLAVCSKGLNHDLSNQLVALHGLLQLLHLEETARLSPAGQDYVRRLLHVAQRTQALARSLRELTRLAGDLPAAEVVALPEVVDAVTAALQPPPVCECDWQAPRVLAPRPLVQQALTTAFQLLAETAGEAVPLWRLCSRPAGSVVELTVETGFPAAPSQPFAAAIPNGWNERLDGVLLRELASAWGGAADWSLTEGGAAIVLTLPPPR
jgi:signal transduction histidine kinase